MKAVLGRVFAFLGGIFAAAVVAIMSWLLLFAGDDPEAPDLLITAPIPAVILLVLLVMRLPSPDPSSRRTEFWFASGISAWILLMVDEPLTVWTAGTAAFVFRPLLTLLVGTALTGLVFLVAGREEAERDRRWVLVYLAISLLLPFVPTTPMKSLGLASHGLIGGSPGEFKGAMDGFWIELEDPKFDEDRMLVSDYDFSKPGPEITLPNGGCWFGAFDAGADVAMVRWKDGVVFDVWVSYD